MQLTNPAGYQLALDTLAAYAKKTSIRTPSLCLLLVLLHHRKGAPGDLAIPSISDPDDGVRVADITRAADRFYEKQSKRGYVVNIFDKTERVSTSVNPRQNNWRNPIGPQAGFRCDAPTAELRRPDFVAAPRQQCPYRATTRRCEISNAICHDPSKGRAEDLTEPVLIPSVPKLLIEDGHKYKLTSLEPKVLSAVLADPAKRVPAWPLAYALYYDAFEFGSPLAVEADRLLTDLFLDNRQATALLDLDPASADNAEFLGGLENAKLVATSSPSLSDHLETKALQAALEKAAGRTVRTPHDSFTLRIEDGDYIVAGPDGEPRVLDLDAIRSVLLATDDVTDSLLVGLRTFLLTHNEVRSVFGISTADQESDESEDEIVGCIPIDQDVKTDADRRVKTRRTQGQFRDRVLRAHKHRCFISQKLFPMALLRAAHIVPWSHKAALRMNLRNGLCLGVLQDAAFDRGLITLVSNSDSTYNLQMTKEFQDWLRQNSHMTVDFPAIITTGLPEQYRPHPDYLRHHNETVFLGTS